MFNLHSTKNDLSPHPKKYLNNVTAIWEKVEKIILRFSLKYYCCFYLFTVLFNLTATISPSGVFGIHKYYNDINHLKIQ